MTKSGDDRPVTEIRVRIVGKRANRLMELQRVIGNWDSLEGMVLSQLTGDFFALEDWLRNEVEGAQECLQAGKLKVEVVRTT